MRKNENGTNPMGPRRNFLILSARDSAQSKDAGRRAAQLTTPTSGWKL
jgi:hypothetical protein